MGGPARHLALGGQAGTLLERRFHQFPNGGDGPSPDGGVGEAAEEGEQGGGHLREGPPAPHAPHRRRAGQLCRLAAPRKVGWFCLFFFLSNTRARQLGINLYRLQIIGAHKRIPDPGLTRKEYSESCDGFPLQASLLIYSNGNRIELKPVVKYNNQVNTVS